MSEKTVDKKAKSASVFKPSEIGQINRKIERSVSGIFAGKRRAIDETISLARERERILVERTARK